MTPYYQDDGITIFHADCRDILPHLEPVDLVLTDPPYPGLRGGIVHMGTGLADRKQDSISVGELWGNDLRWIPDAYRLAQLGCFVFCSYHCVAEIKLAFDSPPTALFTWHKRNAPNAIRNVPRYSTEFIWAFQKQPGLNWRVFDSTLFEMPFLQAGFTATERLVDTNGKAIHPTQKPVELIKKLLSAGGSSILDPFAGSCTTAVAAKAFSRKCICIEISEEYCEIGARRLQQEVLPLVTD